MVCLKANDTVKLFFIIQSSLPKVAEQIVQFALNVSHTMDLLGIVQYYADVVYINAIAASTLQNEIEEEIIYALDCISRVRTSFLPQLQMSADAICNYVPIGQQLYNELVNFSSILQKQLNQVNSSLTKTLVILSYINSTINQTVTLTARNLDSTAVLQANVMDGEAKLNFVNTAVVALKDKIEALSNTITKYLSMPIILPHERDLISLWTSINDTILLVGNLINEVNTEFTSALLISNQLEQLQAKFDTLNNKLSQYIDASILNSNTASSLNLSTDAELISTNHTITNAIAVLNDIQMFRALFSQAQSLLNLLLSNLTDLNVMTNYSMLSIERMHLIFSSFYLAASTVNDTSATVKIASNKVRVTSMSLHIDTGGLSFFFFPDSVGEL